MQVVSGAMGKEKVHFQAPDSARVAGEMKQFLDWFNRDIALEPLLKAALAHVWFLTIHPFEDGNGRMARAISDMVLCRADQTGQRYYSMSAQIRKDRKAYYEMLEKTQKGNMDVTAWMFWYLNCMDKALAAADKILSQVLKKAEFWQQHRDTALNPRQKLMLNKLLDSFEGKLTSSKWAKMTKTSQDTALRDIQDLLQRGLLRKDDHGGRSTAYLLAS
jgi:Fic family protein